MNRKIPWIIAAVLMGLLLIVSAYALPASLNRPVAAAGVATATPLQVASAESPALPSASPNVLAAYEGTLERIYAQVDPSVVNIRVVEKVNPSASTAPGLPFFFGPLVPQGPSVQQGLGSGFVWDKDGHIVTNNHVVAGADQISVTFHDGTTVPAKLVGTDVNSDLAVIKVDVPVSELQPVEIADSTHLTVGQLAVAIGNPFGLQGTMTTGIVSALGRSLPVGDGTSQGPTYSIPDIIQTDAPINPGNSGGVLTDDSGKVIGVTAAIESPVGTSAGIGFAIPSTIVEKVVPTLIQTGHYVWPWFGVSGTNLDPDLAKAMGLKPDQRGALVIAVVAGGPAAKAGLRGSDKQVTIQGADALDGGDVITAINNQPMNGFDDVVTYLADNTRVGETINLTVLRQGKEQTLQVTLAARPQDTSQNSQSGQSSSGGAWLGVQGVTMTSGIAKAMGLSSNQAGVLAEQVIQGSPADQAGLQGGSKSVTIGGKTVQIGGDIIVALDSQPVTQEQDLQAFLDAAQPGQRVILSVLRGGQQLEAFLTLGELPASGTA
jgi:serine protease Do